MVGWDAKKFVADLIPSHIKGNQIEEWFKVTFGLCSKQVCVKYKSTCVFFTLHGAAVMPAEVSTNESSECRPRWCVSTVRDFKNDNSSGSPIPSSTSESTPPPTEPPTPPTGSARGGEDPPKTSKDAVGSGKLVRELQTSVSLMSVPGREHIAGINEVFVSLLRGNTACISPTN